jgi:hypothetical protein
MNVKFQNSNVKGMSKFKYQIQFKMPNADLLNTGPFI